MVQHVTGLGVLDRMVVPMLAYDLESSLLVVTKRGHEDGKRRCRMYIIERFLKLRAFMGLEAAYGPGLFSPFAVCKQSCRMQPYVHSPKRDANSFSIQNSTPVQNNNAKIRISQPESWYS
jgi:hypothetical protein